MFEIRALNKNLVGDRGEYVGRPSALGNPFILEHETDRQQVIQQFEVWLHEQIKTRDVLVCQELNRLYKLTRATGELKLTCWCAPQNCHAEVIKRVLLETLAKSENQMPFGDFTNLK